MSDPAPELDNETQVLERPELDHDGLRLWLRLLTCTSLIETELRTRLREGYEFTLPRFDLMAQLDRVPDGMTLSELSRRMMVSNGNVTGLVARLAASGHLERWTSPSDRRVQYISLTAKGREEFRTIAAEHENWVGELFSGLTKAEMRTCLELLGKVKESARQAARGG